MNEKPRWLQPFPYATRADEIEEQCVRDRLWLESGPTRRGPHIVCVECGCGPLVDRIEVCKIDGNWRCRGHLQPESRINEVADA